jgi:hypothetical protein
MVAKYREVGIGSSVQRRRQQAIGSPAAQSVVPAEAGISLPSGGDREEGSFQLSLE